MYLIYNDSQVIVSINKAEYIFNDKNTILIVVLCI